MSKGFSVENYFEFYKLAFEGREYDSKRLWSLFNLFLIINGGLITLIFNIKSFFLQIIVLIIAIVINLLWSSLSLRMIKWIKWWEYKLVEIEDKLGIEIELFRNRKLQESKGISTKKMSYMIPILFSFLWIIYLFILASFNFKSTFSF